MRNTSRQKKQPQTFTFECQGKRYMIREKYQAQASTLVLTDGLIIEVSEWKIGAPFVALPDHVETFDPQQHSAAEIAAARGGFVAELQQADEPQAPKPIGPAEPQD